MKATPAAPTLVRSLGFTAAAGVAIANMIGQGVFLKARAMTCSVGTPGLMLAAWIVAGVLSLCGALTLAELGAALPESGGIYAFLRRAYGGAAAFAFGWMVLFISSPASVAALAAGAAIFFNLFSGGALNAWTVGFTLLAHPIVFSGVQIGAIAIIVAMTALNLLPAVVNGGLATAFAAFKIGIVVAVIVVAFAAGHGERAHFALSGSAGACSDIAASIRGGAGGFAAALIGALYAYNGWHSLTLLAGEIKRPGRVLPAALVASVLIVMALYVAVNAGYIYVLGPLAIANLASTASVGVTVVATLAGPVWRSVAAIFLFASAAATLHVTIFSNARVTYALAKDTLGFGFLARVSARGHVPFNAVLSTGAIAVVLVLTGSFDALSNYLIFNVWVAFVATGIATFVLRRREPLLPRPYRTFGYPVVPAIYVAVGSWLLIQTAIGSPLPSLVGIAIVAISVPVYFWRRPRAAASHSEIGRRAPR